MFSDADFNMRAQFYEESKKNARRKTEDLDTTNLDNLLAKVERYFENCRFDDKLHLGLGDIRMTIGMQEEVLRMIAKATGQKFDGID